MSAAASVAGLAIVLQCSLLLSSLAAAAVPNGPIVSHLQSAVRSGELSAANYPMGSSRIPVDHFSECVALTNGLGRSGKGGFVPSVLAEPDLGSCATAIPALRSWDVRHPQAAHFTFRDISAMVVVIATALVISWRRRASPEPASGVEEEILAVTP